jgi:hypothetical protein
VTSWVVRNDWGDQMILPIEDTVKSLTLGLLGTGTVRKIENKTRAMATLLGSLDRPLYLLDTRRNGCGGQGSWAPREFATQIPVFMNSQNPYSFVHLPIVAPSIEILEWSRRENPRWQLFRDRYKGELSESAVDVAAAFIESASSRGGMAILLCAEPHVHGFESAAHLSRTKHIATVLRLRAGFVNTFRSQRAGRRLR